MVGRGERSLEGRVEGGGGGVAVVYKQCYA